MSQDVILVAGTVVYMKKTDNTLQRIPRVKTLGAVGEFSEAKEKTTLEDRIKKYGSGLRDAPDKNVQIQYIPFQESGDDYYDDYLLQQEFITRARNEEEFDLVVEWPDGERNGWLWKSLGFQWDEATQEDWKMATMNGKQNSRVIYDVTVTGNSTITAPDTEQMTVAWVPESVVDIGTITWSSSDEAVATVDANGLVTGIAAGTCTITAEIRGVLGTIDITVS